MREVISRKRFRPGFHWRHWIFTIPNNPDPGAAAKVLLDSFARLRQRKIWKSNTTGGFYVVEFTHSSSDWHVHLHVAVYAGYIPFADLRKAWKGVSPGSYIRLGGVPPDKVAGYLTKYLTSETLTPADQVAASSSFRNRRLFNVFGFAHRLHYKIKKSLFPCPRCGMVDGWFSTQDPGWLSRGDKPWGYRKPKVSLEVQNE
jgi:hypothetical protein